jgi:hypothetical protein
MPDFQAEKAISGPWWSVAENPLAATGREVPQLPIACSVGSD